MLDDRHKIKDPNKFISRYVSYLKYRKKKMTLRSVAAEFDISVQRVQQLAEKHKEKIAKLLEVK